MGAEEKIDLTNHLVQSSEAFNVRVRHHTAQVGDSPKIKSNFFFLPLIEGAPSLELFTKYLYDQIPHFCLPYSAWKAVQDKLSASPNDLSTLHDFIDKARGLFIRAVKERDEAAKSKKDSRGELGELILYTILEAFEQAPKVVSKMHLKTNVNMPVHGCDGIHISFSGTAEKLTIHWGESKLYQSFSGALDDTLKSIIEFNTKKGSRKPKDRDVEIFHDHFSLAGADEDLKEHILSFLDPYKENSNNLSQKHSSFICFNWAALKKLVKDGVDPLDVLKASYDARISELMQQINTKYKGHFSGDIAIDFYILPVADVHELKQSFYDRLGV